MKTTMNTKTITAPQTTYWDDDTPLQPYTMDEIRAMIEQSKRESAAGLGIDSEAMFRQLREELATEEELELAEAV
jgi:hypothetical protein